MELLNTKTSHRLEWIIIIVRPALSPSLSPVLTRPRALAQLIAFEISLVLYREGLPFLERSADSAPHKETRSHRVTPSLVD